MKTPEEIALRKLCHEGQEAPPEPPVGSIAYDALCVQEKNPDGSDGPLMQPSIKSLESVQDPQCQQYVAACKARKLRLQEKHRTIKRMRADIKADQEAREAKERAAKLKAEEDKQSRLKARAAEIKRLEDIELSEGLVQE